MRVIVLDDAEKAVAEQMAYEARMEYGGRHTAEDYLLIAKAYFQNCPTIEAEPVRRGRWEYRDTPLFGNPYGSYECSECGNGEPHKTRYCSNCGARMEGQE